MQPWRAILLLAAIAGATPRQQRQHQPLQKVLLVLTVARRDRFYLTRRYERFFGGVAYVIWPQPGCGRVYHGRAGPRQVPCAPLNATDCDAHGLGCLVDRAGAEHRTPTYARLFADLAEADGADVFAPRKEWLRKAWRHTRAPSGVLVAHMDFWLQPLAFQRRVAKGVLPSDAIWTLAAGLNAPPTGPPPEPQHLRIYGKGCLSFEDLVNEQDWTWGHGVRDFAKAAAQELGTAEVCAAQADLFHAPRQAFSYLARAARVFGGVAHEVAAPTILRAAAAFLKLRQVYLDCWGCTQSWCTDPKIFRRHACGHKLDLRQPWVRSAWRALLDAQARKLDAKASPATEAALRLLDRGARDDPIVPPLKPCCRDRTHGCCRLPGAAQTACACVARDPGRPPANGTGACTRPDLVASVVRPTPLGAPWDGS